ncbi:hypothetical protein CYY_007532 [Polysphondylium violaceum]|uniref:Thioredoxin domain-containing protein n=1 Tax=Polysphondylium violaceum TaxID=133409 RepID=A0A8J4PNK3_9MYCE|nr:hypothetical protein CYY_007532 [Polysphondylium violaceum]
MNNKQIISVFLLTLLYISFNCIVSSQDLPKSDVIELTDANFIETVHTKSKASDVWFIEFYTPWCGYCKKLAPIYEDLATKLKSHNNLKIAKIDCKQEHLTCQRFSVKVYPTLKVIQDEFVYDYKGERTFNEMSDFVLGKYSSVLKSKLPGGKTGVDDSFNVIELTDETFDKQVHNSSSDANWMVFFYSDFCVTCQHYLSLFNEIALQEFYNQKVNFGKINCENNHETCELYRIRDYPNLKFFHKSTNSFKDFKFEPTVTNLHSFITRYHLETPSQKIPFNPWFTIFEEAIKDFVWVFLGVSLLFGFFLGFVFFGTNNKNRSLPSSSSSSSSSDKLRSKKIK